MGNLVHLGLVSPLLSYGEFVSCDIERHQLITARAMEQYSPYLRNYATTLGTVSFAKVGNTGDAAVDTFRKTWNVATGQDV